MRLIPFFLFVGIRLVFVIVPGFAQSLLELPHALAQGARNFWDLACAKDKHQDRHDDEDFRPSYLAKAYKHMFGMIVFFCLTRKRHYGNISYISGMNSGWPGGQLLTQPTGGILFTISTRVRYGIRALLELAKAQEREPLSLHEISQRLGLSFKYLENIFMLLKRGNMVRGTRGPEGGYVLVKRPHELSILQIVTALEGPLFSNECTDLDSSCSRIDLCCLRGLWADLQKTVDAYLGGKTLADLLETESSLPELLFKKLERKSGKQESPIVRGGT
ncbi:MAG: Rrf2 family transcriptional regulator [Spirochaetaceae bacterium]|nr:MAG: Rrf2 family transcriptional regulator [Spirochaetaceae bacterium]